MSDVQNHKSRVQGTGSRVQGPRSRGQSLKSIKDNEKLRDEGRKSKGKNPSSLIPHPSSTGVVVSVNISERKTARKKPVGKCKLLEEHGLEKDAHAGDWHRQVSLLALESIEKMREMGLDIGPGDFAENITTKGIELLSLPIGTGITIGDGILLEVTQIGKICHTKCAIYYQAGDCIMPKEGIFARVIKGGDIKVGDKIEILDLDKSK